MTSGAVPPKVFVSYSWTTPAHEKWVMELAERLRLDGVDAQLDKWHLREGQDKNVFMEQMVTTPAVRRVLCICDKAYMEKANARKGGVGTESVIISEGVYRQVDQQKFIPIAREFDENGQPYLPAFFKSRIYIDLSEHEGYESEYEKLLRNIFERPEHQAPPLGKPPAHIFDEGQIPLRTAHKFKRLHSAVVEAKPNARGLLSEYLDVFVDSLEEFRVNLSDADRENLDEPIVESIAKFRPYRDDFVDTVMLFARFGEDSPWAVELFIDAFERMAPYQFGKADLGSHYRISFDNYKFVLYELFLYTVSALIRQRRFQGAAEFLQHRYHYARGVGEAEHRDDTYSLFNEYCAALDEARNQRLQANRISVTADFVKERATRADVRFTDLLQTDALLFLRSCVPGSREHWFPRCILYTKGTYELFSRATSPAGRKNLMTLLGISDWKQLAQTVKSRTFEQTVSNRYFLHAHVWFDEAFNLKQLVPKADEA